MRVAELWRYPVKSMQGERVAATDVGRDGVAGDRQWAIFDSTTGFGLTARRLPALLLASARLRGDEEEVEITLPDGTIAADDAALSAWLGRPVALHRTDEVRTTRRYEIPDDIETESAQSWRPFEGTEHAFHDTFTITLLSATTINSYPMRRFRPNVVLDGAGEDGLVGSTVRIGNAVVRVTDQVRRCVMVTRPQPGGIDLDRDVLRWIHRERGGLLAVGGPVVATGLVSVGDEITRV